MLNVKGLVVKKVGMTRVVDAAGDMVPVTLLKVENQQVTKVLNPERDGYHAIQVGYYEKREKHLTKADTARLRKVNVSPNFAKFKEFRLDNAETLNIGEALTVKILEGVKSLDATGITKGRGFSGAIRRWGSKSGRATHGSMFHRRPGSLGNRATPARVFKGKKIPGHYGVEQNTVQNLKVVDLDLENNLIAVRGSVPGHRNSYLFVKPSIKQKTAKAAN
jgi:large subunit ribosomal protein L3